MTEEELLEQLSIVKYDPITLQTTSVDLVNAIMEGQAVLQDPTNPFVMLQEMSSYNVSNALKEQVNILRRVYPDLALTNLDLYQHMSDVDYIEMFATPSIGAITFLINLKDLLSNGLENTDNNSVELTIPENTEITVADVTFTLLNDVKITFYKTNNKIYAEQLLSDNDLADNSLATLKSTIITDADGIAWIAVETLIKQTKRLIVDDFVDTTKGFKNTYELDDKFYYLEAYIKNDKTNGEWSKIKTTHSDIVFNPDDPTILVKVIDNEMTVEIPKVFIVNESLIGNIRLIVYTTKGKVFLPLNKYLIKDFNISLGDTTKNLSTAVSKNIVLAAQSRLVVDGGSDGKTFEELKENVIFNTIGKIELPITDIEIENNANRLGYKLSKVVDSITERIFIANKHLPEIDVTGIKARASLFNGTLPLVLNDIPDNPKVYMYQNTLVLKSGLVLRVVNGKLEIVDSDTLDFINNGSFGDKARMINSNKYFFTPYYYVIDINKFANNTVESRIYDLDIPKINNSIIINKNSLTPVSCNIDKWNILKTDKGYNLTFTLIGNDEFEKLNKDYLILRLFFKIADGDSFISFKTTYDKVTNVYTCDIESDFYLNVNDGLKITNAETNISVPFINLEADCYAVIYSTDPDLIKSSFSVKEFVIPETDKEIYTVEKINITFGTRIKYLWNKINNVFTERKYLTYQEDVYATYTEDVYDLSNGTCSTITPIDTDDDGVCDTIEYNILHYKGDTILDEEGNPVTKHKAGEIILDANGKPIIDEYGGILRLIDLFLIEYEFLLTRHPAYKEYLDLVLNTVRYWLNEELIELNDITLEKTSILFKPNGTYKDLTTTINLQNFIIPANITPIVTLYIDSDSNLLTVNNTDIIKLIGDIIQKYLNENEINLKTIKDEILVTLGSDVKAVKIENIDSGYNFQYFKINDKLNNLIIDKTLILDENNLAIPMYNINLRIEKV